MKNWNVWSFRLYARFINQIPVSDKFPTFLTIRDEHLSHVLAEIHEIISLPMGNRTNVLLMVQTVFVNLKTARDGQNLLNVDYSNAVFEGTWFAASTILRLKDKIQVSMTYNGLPSWLSG